MKVNMSFHGEQENMPMSFANGNDRLAMDFGVTQSGGVGVGLPPGGTEGQMLLKNSDADYDAGWVSPANAVEQDNTLPITSAAVYTTVGNINALLATI